MEEAAGSNAHGLVLILDDEAIILMGLRFLLESWGYQVLSAMSMDEAVHRVAGRTRTPDLIIADYRSGRRQYRAGGDRGDSRASLAPPSLESS